MVTAKATKDTRKEVELARQAVVIPFMGTIDVDNPAAECNKRVAASLKALNGATKGIV